MTRAMPCMPRYVKIVVVFTVILCAGFVEGAGSARRETCAVIAGQYIVLVRGGRGCKPVQSMLLGMKDACPCTSLV